MAIGLYIAVVIIGILAVVFYKLIRNTSKTSYFGEDKRCQICGRKTQEITCQNCKKDSESLR
ncbi:MAG: hypothetical protein GTN35_01925 [Nitrososphaeria archaeon]|nr:hypothetical protein [Nitrosopumilaceae archaeon]NIP09279.1 hypothetical protein [Nitrosopumilaceae archaeon]NIP91153.1 hypothetical protein [Nitrososphaeria archaeon]NIS94447.1 hypothetical protein [Nitrosopumilaceae archaeon]